MGMQINIKTNDPEGFIQRYKAAFDALSSVAALGSDLEHVGDPRVAPYRTFFPAAPSPEEAARRLEAWRAMSDRERAINDSTARWDIQNVLYMLGPEMRSWEKDDMEISSPSSVILTIEETESPSATGVIRQIIECAGGKIAKEPQPSRSGLLSFFKR